MRVSSSNNPREQLPGGVMSPWQSVIRKWRSCLSTSGCSAGLCDSQWMAAYPTASSIETGFCESPTRVFIAEDRWQSNRSRMAFRRRLLDGGAVKLKVIGNEAFPSKTEDRFTLAA